MDWKMPMVLLMALFLAPAAAAAQGSEQSSREEAQTVQADELVTDRPDFTESSSTVPTGRLQLEGGAQYDYLDFPGGGLHNLSALNLLARIGVADFAELRLQAPSIEAVGLGEDGTDTGFSAASVGAKLATALTDELRVGAIPFVDIGVESADIAGGLIGTLAYDVTETVGLGFNAGANAQEGLDEELEITGFASLSAGLGVTDEVSIFAETFVLSPEEDAQVLADVGVTYLLSPKVQLDAYFGAELPDTDLLFGGAGASILF